MVLVNHPKLKFALNSVKEASLLVKKIQQELIIDALVKSDKSPVTVADFASQAIIGYRLHGSFPDAILVGEEDSTALKTPSEEKKLAQVTSYIQSLIPEANSSDVCDWIDIGSGDVCEEYWTVDPIDGTKGFLRGDQYVVALAFVKNGKVELGVLGCPNLSNATNPDSNSEGSLVFALRDEGTWFLPMMNLDHEPIRLHTSKCQNGSKAQILCSFENAHTDSDQIQEFIAVLGSNSDPIRMDSQAKYALMAAGKGEILLRLLSPNNLDYKEKIWDQAAGSIIIEEAGGKITDLEGNPLDFSRGRLMTNNTGVLATNQLLHEISLKTLENL